MLRRPPTTLSITPEDVAAYEDRRAGEALQVAQQARATQAQEPQPQQPPQPAGSPGQAARRVRDERIGVTRRTGR
ncbi:hypothetical protein TOPH_04302 [Tolypocladium ophioglossoides CBS 100239]|uniref:Anaphase-promoting complex subunit CDC26 n=1 Tax=Tolypocladium ophioglossoides (strain CBS 100239) TaxID=1163406 RepID=A0A0L0NA78_TOLOC|nr:hypothetical protein TOPH_04302 [Tolypocladium ophioglossoides CBS 100239]